MHHFALIIDGKTISSTERATIDVVNPATGQSLGALPCATVEDLDRAAAAAQRGFKVWKAINPASRSEILRKAAQLVREREAEMAQLLTLEQGKPLGEAKGEIAGVSETFEWFAEEGRRRYGRLVPSPNDHVEIKVGMVPVGPVLILTPWNFPVGEVATHLAPALAAGCSAIVKATEEAPSATVMLIDILREAGVPDGVVNLVYGDPALISSHLIQSPAIRKVAFTGSVAVGKLLAEQAGKLLKSTTLELGGNAPAIVFEDADLERTVNAIALRKFRNAGQVCVAPNRIFVQDAIFERFVEALAERARALKVGPGIDPATQMGPVANQRRLDTVLNTVADAIARGARLVTGGKKIEGPGFFMEATVLADVPDDALACCDEIFGPVAVINRFSTADEVIARANSVPVGLAAYMFTNTLDLAHKVSEQLEFGMVGVNTLMIGATQAPFGGLKDSGNGRMGAMEGLAEFLEVKTVTVDHSR